MNAESISKTIVSGEKGPRIAGRTILGVILVVTLFLTAAIVYSRAAIPQAVTNVSVVEAPLASNPEVMLARRFVSGRAQIPGQASLVANPELSLAHRSIAEVARYQALAGQRYNLYGSTAWTRAPKLLTRAQIADAARLSAIAGENYNMFGSTAWTRAPKLLTRAQIADAARLSAIAGENYNMFGSTAWAWAPKLVLNRAQLAEAARLTALAIHYGKPPATFSAAVADLIGP